MIKIFAVKEMVAAEKAADSSGNTYAEMMEKAGRSVARAIEASYPVKNRQVLILVGPGNNGGDGLVAGRYLAEIGADVAFYLYKPLDAERDPNFAKVLAMEVTISSMAGDETFKVLGEHLLTADILVDALLGTGVSRPIEGSLGKMMTHVQRSLNQRKDIYDREKQPFLVSITDPVRSQIDHSPAGESDMASPLKVPAREPVIIAVDCPSGLNCDSGELDDLALKADLTVTFAGPKRGHFLFPGAAACGDLIVADIGIGPSLPEVKDVQLELATADWMRELLPDRRRDGHKGTFGWVVVAAGSNRYWGAPALAGRAAYRVGAGLVAMAIPSSIRPTMATLLPEATYPLIADEEVLTNQAALEILEGIDSYEALLIGPGLSSAASFMKAILKVENGGLPPLVIDADGLNLLSAVPDWHEELPTNTVLTPHIGEMARLVGSDLDAIRDRDRIELTKEKAREWDCIVLLKGAFTIVGAPDGRCAVLPFANPALATAGSGDVLSGIIVGLLGQGLSSFEAAGLGGYLHGAAAEISGVDSGLLASEIADWVPDVIDLLKA